MEVNKCSVYCYIPPNCLLIRKIISESFWESIFKWFFFIEKIWILQSCFMILFFFLFL